MDRRAWRVTVHGVTRVGHNLATKSGFPRGSAGKKSACNVRDLSSFPGLGRSGEGKGYPLQYFWASLVAQLVKNLPARQET